MSTNALVWMKGVFEFAGAQAPNVMTVAETSDALTVAIDRLGNRITLDDNETRSIGQRLIVSGNKIIGKTEESYVTVYIK